MLQRINIIEIYDSDSWKISKNKIQSLKDIYY